METIVPGTLDPAAPPTPDMPDTAGKVTLPRAGKLALSPLISDTLMFQHRVTRKRLGEVLGVTGPAVGRKLRGETGWSLNDLYVAAAYFGVTVSQLLPHRTDEAEPGFEPAPVPPAGFEPATHGLKVHCSAN